MKSSHFFISISSGAASCSPEEKKKQPLQRKLQRFVTSYMELRIFRLEIRLYLSCHSLSSKELTVFINTILFMSFRPGARRGEILFFMIATTTERRLP
jgi:hypothetical protein